MKLFQYIVIIFFTIASALSLLAQEESDKQPLELPNYVIEGRGQINVRSGVKRYPSAIEKLTATELDSINSLQKEQTILLPPKPLHNKIFTVNKKAGFIKGLFGSYITPEIEGGYNFAIDNYKMFADIKMDMSNGDPNNSGYFKIFGGLNSEYLAPDKFFIFGGSITNSKLNLIYNNYNLYAVNKAPNRSLFNMLIAANSKGNFEGYDFHTGGHYSLMTMSTEGNSITDNGLNAYLLFNNHWKTFLVGGGVLIDYHSLSGNSMSFLELSANGQYHLDKYVFDAKAGLQFGNTTANATLFNFLLDLKAKYMLNEDFSFYGKFIMTMENSNFQDYYRINPYISDSTYFDYPILTKFALQMNYHPLEDILVSFGASYGGRSRNPYFENADTATFILKYGSSSLFQIFSEGSWYISKKDELFYHIETNISTINNATIPYTVPLLASATYSHKWMPEFNTAIGGSYISSRYADLKNTIQLDGYIDLFFIANYKINEKFNIFIKLNNLLNQNIYIWNGYRERGLFLGAGVLYRF